MPGRPQRDSLVLMAGALSAAALVFAAFGLVRTPERAGEAALARAGGDVADAVVAEWERMLRAEAPPCAPLGEVFTWGPDETSTPAAVEPQELDAGSGSSAFAALGAEAARLDAAGDVAGALGAALEALSTAASPGQVARGRLRVLQLAARAGRAEVVAEQWAAAQSELSGAETLDGVPVLLLCGLAASPALDEAARAAARESLVERWLAGRLALVDRGERLVLDEQDAGAGRWVSPLREAFAARLDDARLQADLRRRAAAAVLALLAQAPEPVPPASPERWSLVASGAPLPLLWRKLPDSRTTAFFTTDRALRDALGAVLVERALVPEGFVVDIEGGGPGELVRDRTELVGERLGFSVRHRDPASLVTAERVRAGWMRAGLLGMAAFSAVAALWTARAMRREHALAGLRTAFIASVSHELRTPVSSILLLVENLEAGRTGSDSPQRYHALLRREAHRLRRIVDDVLDVSRLERGRPIELRRDVVDLPAFAADLADEARELARRSGAALEARVDVAALPATASLDADALRRAVLNLLDNAAKHAAGGSEIELAVAATPGGGLRITVADRGPGVPAGERQRIFEPFARGAADGAGPPGAGLGLSIVRAIVRGHGGEVAVRGRDSGPGAVFEISLPPHGGEDA